MSRLSRQERDRWRGGGAGSEIHSRWWVFAVTALGAFMASLDLSIVNVAFPSLARSFPTESRAALAWVITAYAIVFAALLVTAGRTADRVGRRRVFFAGLAVFGLGSAWCGLAPSVGLLVAGRVAQGAGAALLLPASLGLLLEVFPAASRSQAVTLWGGVGALAVATGPSLGALLVTAGGWRWAFFVNLPVGALAWLSGRRILPDRRPTVATALPDGLGILAVTVGLASLVLAVSEGPAWGWSNGRVAGAFVLAAALGLVFVRRCARHADPVLDLTLFRSRAFTLANAATVLYAMGFFAMLLGNILFLTAVWHYTILRAGLAVTPGPVVVALVSAPAGRLASRLGYASVLVAGFVVFALGLAWFATVVTAHAHYLAQWLPGTLVVGAGIGLGFPVLGAAAVSELPPERFAVGSAVNQTSRQVGGAIGIAILVALLGPSTTAHTATAHTATAAVTAAVGYRHLWLFAAITSLLAGVGASRIRSGRRSADGVSTPGRIPTGARSRVPAAAPSGPPTPT